MYIVFQNRRPDLSFRVSKDMKEQLRKEMEAANNTISPLYKLCTLQLDDNDDDDEDQNAPTLPDWIEAKLFRNDSPYVCPFEVMEPAVNEFDFYTSKIDLTKDQRIQLCSITMEQSQTSIWQTERRYRITGKLMRFFRIA